MSTSSPILGLPLPENTDILNTEATYGQYAKALDNQLLSRWASTTARDTVTGGNVAKGQVGILKPTGTNVSMQLYDGSAWRNLDTPTVIVKPTDTSRNTTIVSAADPALQFTMQPGTTVTVELVAFFQSTVSTFGARAAWGVSTGITCPMRLITCPSNSTPTVASATQMTEQSSGIASDITVGINNTPPSGPIYWEKLVLTYTSGGTGLVQFLWAQAASGATNTTLKAGSYMVIRRTS